MHANRINSSFNYKRKKKKKTNPHHSALCVVLIHAQVWLYVGTYNNKNKTVLSVYGMNTELGSMSNKTSI